MKHHQNKAAPEAVFQSVESLATYLGVSRQVAYAGLRTGTIPSIRLGKRYIIPRAAIHDWLRRAGLPVVAED